MRCCWMWITGPAAFTSDRRTPALQRRRPGCSSRRTPVPVECSASGLHGKIESLNNAFAMGITTWRWNACAPASRRMTPITSSFLLCRLAGGSRLGSQTGGSMVTVPEIRRSFIAHSATRLRSRSRTHGGPEIVFICDECVEVCSNICARITTRRPRPSRRPDQQPTSPRSQSPTVVRAEFSNR